MEGTNLTKVIIKIVEKETGYKKWIHLCYLPESLFEAYREHTQVGFTQLNETLARRAKEDFSVDTEVITDVELEELKTLVKEYYKKLYPEVYLEQTTDRQGWLRIWITKKIKEELK